MKLLYICCIAISLSFAPANHAWRSSMSFTEKAALITVGGIIVVVAIPVAAVGIPVYVGYKVVKKTWNGLWTSPQDNQAADAIIAAQEAERILANQIKQALDGLKTHIGNLLHAQQVLTEEDAKLLAIHDFIGRQHYYDIAAITCNFKKTFFPEMQEELSLVQLKNWFDTYTQQSTIPEDYIEKAQIFGFSPHTARQLFSYIYISITRAGLNFSSIN